MADFKQSMGFFRDLEWEMPPDVLHQRSFALQVRPACGGAEIPQERVQSAGLSEY